MLDWEKIAKPDLETVSDEVLADLIEISVLEYLVNAFHQEEPIYYNEKTKFELLKFLYTKFGLI